MFEEDKIRFVNETYPNSEESRKWVLSSLMLLKKYEFEWDMDFTQQSYDVLQDAFNRVVTRTAVGATTTLTRFRKYTKWRMQNGLPCTDAVFRLEADRTIAIQDSMVSSPAYLQKVLDVVFDSPYEGTSDLIYRVFLWMGFAGITDTEAIKVTADELDLENMLIRHNGIEYPIYQESKSDFTIVKFANEFVEGSRYKKRVEGREIMRGKENRRSQSLEATLKSTIRPALTRKFETAKHMNTLSNQPEEIGFGLTFNSVFMSGKFYRMYLEEKNGNPPDFAANASKEFERVQESDKPYKVSETRTKSSILRKLRKSEESDYNSWKKAFSLE